MEIRKIEESRVKKLKRKAGITEPESQNIVTYPSGITIPKRRNTVLLRKDVTAESNGSGVIIPLWIKDRAAFFDWSSSNPTRKGGKAEMLRMYATQTVNATGFTHEVAKFPIVNLHKRREKKVITKTEGGK